MTVRLPISYIFIAAVTPLFSGCPISSTPAPADLDTSRVDFSTDVTPDARLQFSYLVVADAWRRVAFEDDPFEPPSDATCDDARGIRENQLSLEPTLEIETTFCGWGTVTQLTTVAVHEGDPINYRVWHFELIGDTDAVVRIRLGDWDLLDETIAQPRDAQLLAQTIASPADFPAGTPVLFHVHNHGANEYSMIELSVGTP